MEFNWFACQWDHDSTGGSKDRTWRGILTCGVVRYHLAVVCSTRFRSPFSSFTRSGRSGEQTTCDRRTSEKASERAVACSKSTRDEVKRNPWDRLCARRTRFVCTACFNRLHANQWATVKSFVHRTTFRYNE